MSSVVDRDVWNGALGNSADKQFAELIGNVQRCQGRKNFAVHCALMRPILRPRLSLRKFLARHISNTLALLLVRSSC